MKRRGNIHWKGATAMQKRPDPKPEPEVPFDVDRLVVGAMFMPLGDMGNLYSSSAQTSPPTITKLFYVSPSRSDVIVPKNAILMYAGMIRIDKKANDRVVRVPRHTFVAGSGRYIIENLSEIKPID